jgi:hypothetical protein
VQPDAGSPVALRFTPERVQHSTAVTLHMVIEGLRRRSFFLRMKLTPLLNV